MMDLWRLPKSANFGGIDYEINSDFRDILDIMDILSDNETPISIRWEISLRLFYEGEIPIRYKYEATDFMNEFISYGDSRKDKNKKSKKLIDWKIDASIIIGDVNKVAGFDVRDVPYIHWWTFLSYFNGIGEGQLSTVVSIRKKLAEGKKLEKWEQEFYKDHKMQIEFRDEEEENKIKEYFEKWL